MNIEANEFKSSTILKGAKEMIQQERETFTCLAVARTCSKLGFSGYSGQAEEIKAKISEVLDLSSYGCNCLENKYSYLSASEGLEEPNFREQDAANYIKFARLQLCDFLINYYEQQGD